MKKLIEIFNVHFAQFLAKRSQFRHTSTLDETYVTYLPLTLMKNFIYIIVTISVSFASLGQQLETQVFVQQTVMGIQKGYGFYLKNEKGWGIGFVQQSLQPFASTEKGRTDYTFTGISTQIPIQNCHKLLLLLTPKVGLVNGQFLAILPEITTSYQLFRNVDLQLGAGLRARKSAVSVAVTYQFF